MMKFCLFAAMVLSCCVSLAQERASTENRGKDAMIQVVGHQFFANFGDNSYLLDFKSEDTMDFKVLKGIGKNQTVKVKRTEIRPNVYMVTWQEADKTTVTHVEDFGAGVVYTNITMPDFTFLNLKGTLLPASDQGAGMMPDAAKADSPNVVLVKQFLDLAFNKNEIEKATELVTERYIQHNPYVADGKTGFIQGIKAFRQQFPQLKWTPKHVFTDGDYVIVHSEYEKDGPHATVDIFRIKDGKIDEHWDVDQKIPPTDKSANSNTMF